MVFARCLVKHPEIDYCILCYIEREYLQVTNFDMVSIYVN